MKNLKVSNNITKKRISALAIAGIMGISSMLGFSSCSKNQEKVDETLSTVTEVFKDNTKLDEAIKLEVAMYKDMSITEACDKLEKAINIVKKLENVNFDGVEELDKLSEEEYNKALNMSEEEVDILLEEYNNASKDKDSLKSEEIKLKSIKKLDYIYRKHKTFVDNNAKDISKELLMFTTKSTIAEALNIKGEDLNTITYPWGNSNPEMIVSVNDKNNYILKRNAEGIGAAVNTLYDMDSKNDELTYDYYLEIINLAKKTIMIGATKEKAGILDPNDKIVSKDKFEDSNIELKKRTLKK